MPISLETLAALATIAGLVVSILALVQSRAWLLLTSLVVIGLSIGGVVYARRMRSSVAAASIVIEGRSIDSLNLANLKRRVNRTFVIQEARHEAYIKDEDIRIAWTYRGYCKSTRQASFEFSVDSDNSVSFERLDCVAYDLGSDPQKMHPIRPLLVSSDGVSKKISVPFLKSVKGQEAFGVLLECTLPKCVKKGLGYYVSTSSFAQERLSRCDVKLIFAGTNPAWVRVYDCLRGRPPELVKTLAPLTERPGIAEYIDVVRNRPGQSARVYMFWRDSI